MKLFQMLFLFSLLGYVSGTMTLSICGQLFGGTYCSESEFVQKCCNEDQPFPRREQDQETGVSSFQLTWLPISGDCCSDCSYYCPPDECEGIDARRICCGKQILDGESYPSECCDKYSCWQGCSYYWHCLYW
eukprot:TRINITY_DN12237_c1_g1_i1.p1 TRINITY_DN12237_c1_g1~~TRINITY_DN12237_c1_g1_i1.p1  ORF type:complete len:132 (+),score=0.47 TRINITY_DN12237_c1_g1_i1:69-464(+)